MNAGDIIDNKYQVIDELGEGGMGRVMRVIDLTNNQEVALKYCKDTDEASIRRFNREVRIMSEVTHLNIIPVLSHNLTNVPPYFVMPLAKTSLSKLIPSLLKDLDKTLYIFTEICNGINAMHVSNNFHRDIKPSNVLILPNGQVVVSDFGLAKRLVKDSSSHSSSNNFLGTVGYHAPEQVEAKNSDARTDVYQLGKTLYELLTNEYPYLINSSKIPPGINHIIQRATAINPDDRYQTVSDLQQAIQTYQLSLKPDANPVEAFKNQINAIKNLLRQGQYDENSLKALLDILDKVKHMPSTYVELFDSIPSQILKIYAKQLNGYFEGTFTTYNANLREYNDAESLDYSYAETVADRMFTIFDATDRIDFKIMALENTLEFAVRKHRYAAMDIFSNMVQSIKSNDEAVAVADTLRKLGDYYSVVYDRVPIQKLHFIIQSVWNEIDKQRAEQKAKEEEEMKKWLNSLDY